MIDRLDEYEQISRFFGIWVWLIQKAAQIAHWTHYQKCNHAGLVLVEHIC